MFGMGANELIIVGVIAVLLFGRKLPEVARSLGSSYREFRKGLSDIQSQVDFSDSGYSKPQLSSSTYQHYEEMDDYEEATAPKFEPPPAPAAPSSADPASEDTAQV